MPDRQYSAGNSYRYGFNGKENDNEVKGEGNQQDYGMRIYDPRLGRFLSVDPVARTYPMLTPYQFACNRPIDGLDLDGLEYFRAGGKYMRALYGLNKFESVSNKYTMGHLAIRSAEIHKIVEEHPRVKASEKAPAEDDSTPEVTMVKQRREDNAKPRNQTAKDVKSAQKAMTPDILGGLFAFIQWAKETKYDITHGDDLEYAAKSIYALHQGDKLLRAASNNVTFPTVLQKTNILTDLANYLSDGTLPKDVDISYSGAILSWSYLMLKNEKKVLDNTFDFAPTKWIVERYERKYISQSDMLYYDIPIMKQVGNSDPDVIKAHESLKGFKPPPAATMKQKK